MRDLYDAVGVKVLLTPASTPSSAFWEFINSTWGDGPEMLPRPPDQLELLNSLTEEGRLWHAQEIMQFMVQFYGITRITTHCLVRQRVGVTFAQHCSAGSDWRHRDVLVPRSIKDRERYIRATIDAKVMYANMVDRGVGIQEARSILPQNLETFLYMYAPISVVADIYRKRICTMISGWEMICLMQRLRRAVVAAAPYTDPMFSIPCKEGACWWSRADPNVRINMFAPDRYHDRGDWNARSFEHSNPPDIVAGANKPSVATQWFIGQEEAEEGAWKEAIETFK